MIKLKYIVQQFVFIALPIALVYAVYSKYYIVAGILFVILSLLIWGIFDIRVSLLAKVINRLKTSEKQVVLTFDDGPNAYTPQILAILKSANVKAVFFIIGKNAEKHPEIVKQIVEDGHTIGIHTQRHAVNFPFYGSKKVEKELKDCQQILESITSRKIILFRPPFGIINPVIAKVARQMGLTIVGWGIRSLDTKAKDADKLLHKISGRLSNGSIILLHDIEITTGMLPKLISEIQKTGFVITNDIC